MEMPAPVPVGALQALLARSKQVMDKSLTDKPIISKDGDKGLTESYTPKETYGYDEADEKDMSYGEYKSPERDATHVSDYTDEQVMSSNFPQNIKEAMLKNRIPKVQGLPSKVTAEAITKMTGIQPKKPQVKQPINESVNNSGMITVSNEQLQNMIQEGISKFFREDYEQRITEAAIKKTINVLIKEGKLNTKK